MQPKRTGRFYRKNERDVMEQLGVKPTKNSGSGWLEKEDGIGELTMVQLKSTDAQQMTIKQKDIRILEQHARESHKAPVFAIQFLNTGEVWLMAKQEDLAAAAIEIGNPYKVKVEPVPLPEREPRECARPELYIDENGPGTVVRSSIEGKEEFYRNAGNRKYSK